MLTMGKCGGEDAVWWRYCVSKCPGQEGEELDDDKDMLVR